MTVPCILTTSFQVKVNTEGVFFFFVGFNRFHFSVHLRGAVCVHNKSTSEPVFEVSLPLLLWNYSRTRRLGVSYYT